MTNFFGCQPDTHARHAPDTQRTHKRSERQAANARHAANARPRGRAAASQQQQQYIFLAPDDFSTFACVFAKSDLKRDGGGVCTVGWVGNERWTARAEASCGEATLTVGWYFGGGGAAAAVAEIGVAIFLLI